MGEQMNVNLDYVGMSGEKPTVGEVTVPFITGYKGNNPGTAAIVFRERIFDERLLVLTGENGRTKKRIKFTNHKGDNHDF
ncbi:MAG: hypothetical protein QG657_3341 [Acidobacteriota bacterium]|nr:hypothetical protein [Acidobacteriota bacterium]